MESNSDKSDFTYFDSIDILRFLLVTIVISAHTNFWAPCDIASVAVKCFFVLSGFLITERLIAQKPLIHDINSLSLQYKNFALKRILRIFPIYYLSLIAVKIFFADSFSWTTLFTWNFTYLSNFQILDFNAWPGMYSHLWTLAIEEQFYVFWPILIFLTPIRFLIYLFIFIVSIGVFTRALFDYLHFDGYALWSHVFSLSVVDLFGIGAIFSVFYTGLLKIDSKRIAIISFTLFVTLVIIYFYSFSLVSHPNYFFLPLVVGLLSATSILLLMIFNQTFSSPFWSPFKYFGKISYGIYLYHNFIFAFVIKIFQRLNTKWDVGFPRGFYMFIIVLIITIVVSHFSWILIEKPIMKFKNRIS